jgi:hypothetical protein
VGSSSSVKARRLANSLLWSSGNVLLVVVTFLALRGRFTDWGLELVKVVLVGFLVTLVLSARDLWKRSTRGRAFLALLLCLPVLFLFSMLMQWEGPLYVVVKAGTPINFHIRGASGFYGLKIYGPEHEKAEWSDDDIGLVWDFDWRRHDKFPRMKAEFAYGMAPPGYVQGTPATNTPPLPLDPEMDYTLALQPGMGMPCYFTLHGNSISGVKGQFGPDVCWGSLGVSGRSIPAYVRVDCNTRNPLPMSQRAQNRLKAYQENRIAYY